MEGSLAKAKKYLIQGGEVQASMDALAEGLHPSPAARSRESRRHVPKRRQRHASAGCQWLNEGPFRVPTAFGPTYPYAARHSPPLRGFPSGRGSSTEALFGPVGDAAGWQAMGEAPGVLSFDLCYTHYVLPSKLATSPSWTGDALWKQALIVVYGMALVSFPRKRLGWSLS